MKGLFMNKVINSPIRWAGSKKKLLNEMLNSFPKNKKVYIEPFLGSGVVLINLLNNKEIFKYEKFYANDINDNIISFYTLLKNEYSYVKKNINKLMTQYNDLPDMQSKQSFYYNIRKKYNNKKVKINAIYFFFLMKTGYNGVYRENSQGQFNVPFGKKETISVDFDNLKNISDIIKNVEFFNMEYKDFLDYIGQNRLFKDAFIYCDPPYLREEGSINQKQELYTKHQFNHEEFLKNMQSIKDAKYVISMI
jgi:DNA adenine methylase